MGEFSQRSLSKHKNTHENWQFAPQSGLISCSTFPPKKKKRAPQSGLISCSTFPPKKKSEWSTGWLYLSPCNFNSLLQHRCLHIPCWGKAETKSERSKYLSSWHRHCWLEWNTFSKTGSRINMVLQSDQFDFEILWPFKWIQYSSPSEISLKGNLELVSTVARHYTPNVANSWSYLSAFIEDCLWVVDPPWDSIIAE